MFNNFLAEELSVITPFHIKLDLSARQKTFKH